MDSAAESVPLSIRDLTFRYRIREEPAIRNLAFDLRAGELLLIAGASGCGKTTLMRCVNGLIPRSYRGELQGAVILVTSIIFNVAFDVGDFWVPEWALAWAG